MWKAPYLTKSAVAGGATAKAIDEDAAVLRQDIGPAIVLDPHEHIAVEVFLRRKRRRVVGGWIEGQRAVEFASELLFQLFAKLLGIFGRAEEPVVFIPPGEERERVVVMSAHDVAGGRWKDIAIDDGASGYVDL